jgi:hypothetical protein
VTQAIRGINVYVRLTSLRDVSDADQRIGRNKMYQTVQVSSCVSVQGFLVEHLPNGDAIVSDGLKTYRGRPIAPMNPTRSPLRAIARCEEA